MPEAIEFQKEFTEKVYINLPATKEFEQWMTGTDQHRVNELRRYFHKARRHFFCN
jgi:hypothetical protein